MNFLNILALQEQSTPFTAKTPQEAANWGADIVFKATINGCIWFVQIFWPVILLAIVLVTMNYLMKKNKEGKLKNDKKKLHWKKQRPNK